MDKLVEHYADLVYNASPAAIADTKRPRRRSHRRDHRRQPRPHDRQTPGASPGQRAGQGRPLRLPREAQAELGAIGRWRPSTWEAGRGRTMSEVESAGAAVTAGLVAAAIDGPKKKGGPVKGTCLNCGSQIDGRFCADCGQPANIHRTLGHMVAEVLRGIFNLDTRAWKTLPLLLFRPGTLTRSYIHGQRARYISPLAMFLLSVFTMFVVFGFTNGSRIGVSDPVQRAAALEEARTEIGDARQQVQEALARRNGGVACRCTDSLDAADPADTADRRNRGRSRGLSTRRRSTRTSGRARRTERLERQHRMAGLRRQPQGKPAQPRTRRLQDPERGLRERLPACADLAAV